MLAVALFTFFFFSLGYSYGWGILSLFRKLACTENSGMPSFPWVVAAGLVAITTIGSVLSLIMPLSAGALGLITAGGSIIAVLKWKKMKADWRIDFVGKSAYLWILGAVLVLALLESATHLPANSDTGLYHAQTIHWIEGFPVVPGLGNLNGRFAFNSSWLLANALFSFAFFEMQSFHLLPASLISLGLLICLEGMAAWLRGESTPVNILKTLFIPLVFYVLAGEISSPGTDLPVVMIVWMVAAGCLELGVTPQADRPALSFVLILLSIYAFTIKLSAAPLLIFTLLFITGALKNRRLTVVKIAAVVILLLPWTIRNVILSGYPVFPVAGIPGFDVDWRIPPVDVADEQNGILAWGRNADMPAEKILQVPLQVWLKDWFFDQTINRKAILLLSGGSPLLLGLATLISRRWQPAGIANSPRFWTVLLVNLAGTCFWLFTSPDFRFGYGYLIVLLILPWPIFISTTKLARKVSLLAALVIIGYLGFFTVRSFDVQSLPQRLILPLDYPVLPTQPCDLANAQIFCPAEVSYSQCWYEPFPCAPFPRPNVELRGSDLSDGFRKSS